MNVRRPSLRRCRSSEASAMSQVSVPEISGAMMRSKLPSPTSVSLSLIGSPTSGKRLERSGGVISSLPIEPPQSAGRPVSGTCSTVSLRRKLKGRSRPEMLSELIRSPVFTSMIPLRLNSPWPARIGVRSKGFIRPSPSCRGWVKDDPSVWKVKPSASHSSPNDPVTVSCSLPRMTTPPAIFSPT